MSSPAPPTDLPFRLPETLAERCRQVGPPRPPARDAAFVLYWMHHAVRAHENPALDVAVTIANALDLPVLVYQGLGGQHPFNNDRHHTFILEGARDAHRDLAARGIRAAFHLGAHGDSPLCGLAARAAVVVTEDFPIAPFAAWTRALAASCDRPTIAVDCACIVPMRLHTRRYDRAYEFRNASRAAFAARVPRAWTDTRPLVPPVAGSLGFDTIDLATTDIASLCATCDIDHSVPPVAHTRGGSDAGYARWQTFRRHGLAAYARTRNDAALDWPNGVSRMSAYLHHGHVSPLRIAREAWMARNEGAEKYLDELLVWRELAFNFCCHSADPGQLAALPRWARETLAAHAGDRRNHVHDNETLARSQTGDELWDLAQTSLRIHGELHNNLRMTWAKAILPWRPNTQAALDTLLRLNHRYALDGSDPNSYAGLLWALGLFDRPFPDSPVLGRLRPRPTRAHANRLDLGRYRAKVNRPASGQTMRIAVIGAGMAGLVAARTLHDHGHAVSVFEKSRGLGGRMATRRAGDTGFDHGAQYFTARDARFRECVAAWLENGFVAPWQPRVGRVESGRVETSPDDTARFVAVPGMSVLGRHLAAGLDIRTAVRVRPARRHAGQWELHDDNASELGRYDALIVATPPAQAHALIGETAPSVAATCAGVDCAPTWAVMVETTAAWTMPYDALFFADGPLAWAARNDSKPGRHGNTWVIHARHDWSRDHVDDTPGEVAGALVSRLCETCGTDPSLVAQASAHRWLYALADEPLSVGALWSGEHALAVCGDWCHGSRVEGAFLSGQAAAGYLLRAIAAQAEDGMAFGITDPASGSDAGQATRRNKR